MEVRPVAFVLFARRRVEFRFVRVFRMKLFEIMCRPVEKQRSWPRDPRHEIGVGFRPCVSDGSLVENLESWSFTLY